MRGNRSFNNIFLSNASPFDSFHSSGFLTSLKESQYLNGCTNIQQESTVYSYQPISQEKNISTQQNSLKNSVLYNSQISGKKSLLLERSRSQIIQPVYFSPLQSTFMDFEKSKDLGASKASQITFSKPSEFIINTPKQNAYLEDSKKKIILTPKIAINDDYGNNFGSFYCPNPSVKQSMLNVTSPMKHSYFSGTLNPARNNSLINPLPQVSSQFKKEMKSPLIQYHIYSPKSFSCMQIFKDPSSTGFTIRPEIRRCLSKASIISQKSKNKLSESKIKFTYISPVKNENKTVRKLSFKKEEVKNPLKILSKKQSQGKTKVQINTRPKMISEVVNEYFPEFKIKKNKMKGALSPKAKDLNVINEIKNGEKSDNPDNNDRRHTFIASLDAINQLSEIKPISREGSTQGSTDTPKKVPFSDYEYGNTENRPNKPDQSMTFKKITGYRITLDGQKVPLQGQKKEEIHSNKESSVSENSELSVISIKNEEDLELNKKNGHDSSHTTDYEDEIVKKIKQDLGLNFSYYNKR